jgi:hypothetical protein
MLMTNRLTGVRAAAALTDLGFASISVGVLARRRPVVRLLERMQADERAVKRMQQLRREFGSGPVELVLPRTAHGHHPRPGGCAPGVGRGADAIPSRQ